MSRSNEKHTSVYRHLFSRFRREENGILSVEAIMVFPLVIWSIWASYSFFDGYRQSARNLKASYAVADVISRERTTINATYIDTLYGLLQTMVADRSDVSMRITYLVYKDEGKVHRVEWSCVRGETFQKWSTETFEQIKGRLPEMTDEGKMIVVETEDLYRRPYQLGFGDNEFTMSNFVFTQPRHFDQIRIDPQADC